MKHGCHIRLAAGGARQHFSRSRSAHPPGSDPVHCILLALPLAIFFLYSFLTAKLFTVSGPITVASLRPCTIDRLNCKLAANSIAIGLLGATLSVSVALPVSYWLRYLAGRLAIPCLFIITASMFASYLVRIYAWRTILGANGVFNQGLEARASSRSRWASCSTTGSRSRSRWSTSILPYVVLVLYAGFRPYRAGLLEAAQDLGANMRREAGAA